MTNLSLKDIARLSGVSTATVSRVINQNGRFSRETERRVQEVIEKYNYKPNQIAQNLRRSSSNAIGIIVPDITNEFFASIIVSIQRRLTLEDYTLLIYNTNESDATEEKYLSVLTSQNVIGVICVDSRTEVRNFIASNIPIVYIDNYRFADESRYDNFVYISSDNEYGGFLAAKALSESGCSSAGVIAALEGSSVTDVRTKGFLDGCKQFGIEITQEGVLYPQALRFEEGQRLTRVLLEKHPRINGLFCETDWLALGSLSVLLEKSIGIPDEMRLVGFDGVSISEYAAIPFTTIRQDTALLGVTAAEAMMHLLDKTWRGSRRIFLPVSTVHRRTT